MKTKKVVIPASARRQMELLPKYPKRYTLEDRAAFLATLPQDFEPEAKEFWDGLDELAQEELWRDSERREQEEINPDEKEQPAPIITEDGYMSTKEAARYLGLSPKAVRNMARRGDIPGDQLPHKKRRGRWRFKKRDLDKWLKRRRRRDGGSGDVSIW